MLKTLQNAFKVKDVRHRIFYVLMMLVVIRIGSQLPVPGVDGSYFKTWFESQTGDAFNFLDAFTGGSFSQMSIFALSITPYITSSIIIQLLTIAIPKLEEMQRDGEDGRKKLGAITRYVTIGLSLFESIAMAIGFGNRGLIPDNNFVKIIVVVVALTAGSAFLMWVGEQINEKGIGNGISLIIFGGIVARLPSGLRSLWTQYSDGTLSIITLLLFAVFAIVVILGVIEVQQGTRRIPVQYAKRVVGRKMYGGQSTHIPLKVNQAGVIPVIFAMSFLQFPLTVTYFFPDSGFTDFITKWLSPAGNPGVWVYAVLNVLLIIFFNYFYTAVTFNPVEVAQNMKANGGFIPGIRPGKATIEYLNKVMSRISFVGAIFLAVIATMPTLVSQFSGLDMRFGGTSLLIAVGVALDTMKQLENQMVMRNYQGFLK